MMTQHSIARILFLHSLGLNLHDVADLIVNQADIEWEDKRISKKLITDILYNGFDSDSELIGTEDGWMKGKQLAVLHVLDSYYLTLFDLRRYFDYDNELLEALKYDDMSGEKEVDKPTTVVTEDDPTWVHPRDWQKLKRMEGAEDAIIDSCDTPDAWEVIKRINNDDTLVVKIEFGRQFRVISLSTMDRVNRRIIFCGDHKHYDYYRRHSISLVAKTFNGSDEKKNDRQLSLFQYTLRNEDLRIPPNH
jgi:hypothetical protein